jgi:hypothetical protein
MPRSIQEILDHADELARSYEDYDPAEGDQVPVEEYLLRRAVLTRARYWVASGVISASVFWIASPWTSRS